MLCDLERYLRHQLPQSLVHHLPNSSLSCISLHPQSLSLPCRDPIEFNDENIFSPLVDSGVQTVSSYRSPLSSGGHVPEPIAATFKSLYRIILPPEHFSEHFPGLSLSMEKGHGCPSVLQPSLTIHRVHSFYYRLAHCIDLHQY